jgi:hypothetical protein
MVVATNRNSSTGFGRIGQEPDSAAGHDGIQHASDQTDLSTKHNHGHFQSRLLRRRNELQKDRPDMSQELFQRALPSAARV